MMKIQQFTAVCDTSCMFWRSHLYILVIFCCEHSEKRIQNQSGFSSEDSSELKGASPSNLP